MTKLQESQPASKVSKISLSTRIKDLYQIFIDTKFFCSISGHDLLESRLAVGDKLDQSQLKDLLYRSLKGKLTSSALRYLGSRPHSENEIRQFLKKKIYAQYKETEEYRNTDTDKIIDEILSTLRSLRYVNDEEFAKWLVTQRSSARNGKSKNAIRAELKSKGLDESVISESLNELDTETEEKRAINVAEKKLRTLKNRNLEAKDLYNKLARYVMSKGYSWETTQSAVDSLLKPF